MSLCIRPKTLYIYENSFRFITISIFVTFILSIQKSYYYKNFGANRAPLKYITKCILYIHFA